MEGQGLMLKSLHNVHLMGIGGAGMSGLARLLHEMGFAVSGCDVTSTSYVERVLERGIPVSLGHSADHLENYGVELLVYSSAIAPTNLELLTARERGIAVARRAEILSMLFNERQGIGIAGTHGKTTTSSMIGLILETADLSPTLAIGGELCDIGGNAKLGGGACMVAELDESDGSFELFHCQMAVVTNVDWDHVDHYPNLDSVKDAFVRFLGHVKPEGISVLCAEDPGVAAILPHVKGKNILTYGWGKGWNWGATHVHHIQGGGVSFIAHKNGVPMGDIVLGLSGEHNVLNALAACAVADTLGIPFAVTKKALRVFRGAKRRLQYVGSIGDVQIYDDYGHHPNEIAATLRAVRSIFPGHRLIAIFQPHRYTRTAAMFGDFAKVLPLADEVFLLPIYPADEEQTDGVSSVLIADAMECEGHACHFCQNMKDVQKQITALVRSGDVILTIGAGNVCLLGPRLLQALREGVFENAMVVGA
jgi:UDP-N-acetylmuramate--alanine ligase